MAVFSMGEYSPSQERVRGIFRTLPDSCVAQTMSVMVDGGIEKIRQRITSEMDRKKFSRRKLSAAAGLSESAVRDVLDRTTNPGILTLQKIARALSISTSSITEGGDVLLMGEISVGGRVREFAKDQPAVLVDRPPSASEPLIALRVEGDSMLPKYEAGDVIYVENVSGVDPQTHLGRYCFIELLDGSTYVRKLTRGANSGRYTLQLINSADIEDVEIANAFPIVFVKLRG